MPHSTLWKASPSGRQAQEENAQFLSECASGGLLPSGFAREQAHFPDTLHACVFQLMLGFTHIRLFVQCPFIICFFTVWHATTDLCNASHIFVPQTILRYIRKDDYRAQS